MDEELLNMLHTDFPIFLKNFLNEFAETKFYKKTLEDRKLNIDGIENYYYFDWECPTLSPFNRYTNEVKINALLKIGIFGAIPHYQYDKLKVIVIDFKNKEAYLERGFATEPYASYVLKKRFGIPKYMKPLIEKLFKEYDDYMKGDR